MKLGATRRPGEARITLLEVNYDGLVGPTHNYAGLSAGNVASLSHGGEPSSPKRAALQGLEKMRTLVRLGLRQGVLPPQDRPALSVLRGLGFAGEDARVVERAGRDAPALLAACYSASSMWAANAATVAPSPDTADGRVHFTPANLATTFHRSLEPTQTARALRRLFADPEHFAHHAPLPAHARYGDEGAANHTRLSTPDAAGPGVHLFVYGRDATGPERAPRRYPARQTLEASRSVARLHGLNPARVVFAQQAPDVIDAGVFHNDVIAVGHGSYLFRHAAAYLREDALDALTATLGPGFQDWVVPTDRIPVERAVQSYLFNSQLVYVDDTLHWLAPIECQEDPQVHAYLRELEEGPSPVSRVHILDVRESMKNGGGPACLRLRVPLTETEWQAAHSPAQLDDETLDRLQAWVQKHYRDTLHPADLRDPQLAVEARTALDELTQLLALGDDFYPFQRT